LRAEQRGLFDLRSELTLLLLLFLWNWIIVHQIVNWSMASQGVL